MSLAQRAGHSSQYPVWTWQEWGGSLSGRLAVSTGLCGAEEGAVSGLNWKS